jgi:tetratricopeptide (TPR) repeat protein
VAPTDPNAGQHIFDSIHTLLDVLQSDDEPGRYVYRGQAARFTHRWDDGGEAAELECLYPSDYRFIANFGRPSELVPGDVTAARRHGRNVRDMILAVMTVKAGSNDPAWAWVADDLATYLEQLQWLKKQTSDRKTLQEVAMGADEDVSPLATRFVRLFWSLAQHYLMATALTDVTYSPRVAAWFATQSWDPSIEAPNTGTGVVYRFERERLEEILREEGARMNRALAERDEGRAPDFFLIDIRDIPAEFAGRPSGQQGGSVYGLDQPNVLRALVKGGCLEALEFRHTDGTGDIALLRSEIVPDDDPFAALAENLSAAIEVASKATVVAVTGAGDLPDPVATMKLSELKRTAGLAIDSARLVDQYPIGDSHEGFLFSDIESSGHHGYESLLAVSSVKTDAVLGYVSLEPLAGFGGDLPGQFYVLASWFEGVRAIAGIEGGADARRFFPERADAMAKEAIGVDAEARLRRELGQIIAHFGSPDAALRGLARHFRNGDLDSGVNLGMLLVALDRFDDAVVILEEAHRLGSVDAAYNLGTNYTKRRDYENAERWLAKALEGGDREARYNLGRVRQYQADWESAERWYREAHDIDKHPYAPNNLGVALIALGRTDEAHQYLELAAARGDRLAARTLRDLDSE